LTTTPMKIIHLLLGKANPDRMNGVNKAVHQLAVAQHKLGYDVALWGLTRDTQAAVYQRPIPTVLYPDFGPLQPLAERLREAILTMPQPVIFHLHGAFTRQIYMVARLLTKKGIGYAFTPHGAYNTMAMHKNRWLKWAYGWLFERRLLRGAGMVHLIGHSEVEATLQHIGPLPTVLVPNGQALPAHQGLLPGTLKSGSCLTFGFLGRLTAHTKGLDLLLQGYALFVANTQVNSQLVIIGDGADRAMLQQLARRLGLVGQVQFAGALYGQAKTDALQRLHVLAQPSRNEGLPGAVLEAAALGIPLLVSQASNMGTYVTQHQAGWCLPQNTANAIAEAMHNIALAWQNQHLEATGINAYNMVHKIFQWPAIAQQMVQHYKRML